MTDDKATEALQVAQEGAFFLPKEEVSGPVFSINGLVVVDLTASLDKVYDDEMHWRAQEGLTRYDGRWSSHGMLKAIKDGQLTNESLKMLFLLRALGMEVEREGQKGDCKWCGQNGGLGAAHLTNHCPDFYLRWVRQVQRVVDGVVALGEWHLRGIHDLEARFEGGG